MGAFVFCITAAMKSQILASQDLYLHIATGRWILANHLVPDHGIFSATMPNAPWVAHEWLAAVFFAFLYDHLGWGGVLAATSLALATAIGALALDVAKRLTPIGAIVAAVLAWGLCVHHLVARPHILVMPLVVFWIAAHVSARRNNKVPPFSLAILMALWANLHASFMFGVAFTTLFAGEAIFESRSAREARDTALGWGAFLAVVVLAALATPHGLGGILFPVQALTQGGAFADIKEWQPSSLSNNPPLLAWCFLLLFLALFYGVKLPICRLAMLMLLLYMAFAHQRHAELLGLSAPLLLQDAIAKRISQAVPLFRLEWHALAKPIVGSSIVGVALCAASIAAFAACRNAVRGPDEFTPSAALQAVEQHGITGAVFNDQKFGGYLIFRGYAPFIDGRVDMYGSAFMSRYEDLNQLTSLLKQYRVSWTILSPNSVRVALMDNLPGWSRFFSDDIAVVHVREIPERR